MTTTIRTYNEPMLSIHTSVASGQLYLVQRLIADGCDPNLPHTTTGLRPIHFAASRGHIDLVQYLVESTHSCQIDAVDKEEETALLKAAYAGHFSVVKYLIEHGADYLHQDRDGWTALHNACSCGNFEMIKFLCSQPHIDVNITSKQGHTPLMNAASKGFVDIVLWLLKHNANSLLENNFGETAYDVAAAANEAYLCHLLDPHHLIDFHITIPVILVEQVTYQQHTSYLSLTLPTETSTVDYYTHKEEHVQNKSKMNLPNTSWFWLTDWTVDHTFPRLDELGWSYYDQKHDTWSEQKPRHYQKHHIKRRRWVRIMKKVAMLAERVVQDEQVDPEISNQRHSNNSTRSLNTTTLTKAIFVGCSTLPQPLLQEQMSTSDTISAWERNDQVMNCRRCHRFFNLLVRRHHCRKCGQIICDRCSTNRIMLSREEIIQPPDHQLEAYQPQRICDHCVEQIVISNSKKKRNSMMTECPVCVAPLFNFNSVQEQEQHVQSCLSKGQPSSSVRYVVYKLNSDSMLIGQECVICFEEFNLDDTITRLNCMCSYHRHCIDTWFSKGKECPIHSQ